MTCEDFITEFEVMAANLGEVDNARIEKIAAEIKDIELMDQLCIDIIAKSPVRDSIAEDWVGSEQTLQRRGAWILLAEKARHDKEAIDEEFETGLTLIEARLSVEEETVKEKMKLAAKAIGKRNAAFKKRVKELL